tara:strand:- start:1028 stop:1519 length:492 start_codon:yes stop_codon:yes gene_type:complete
MARITVEDCLEKVENQYDLVLLAKERTSQLNSGAKMLVEEDNDKKTVIALREIGDGKVDISELRANAILRLRKEPDDKVEEEVLEEVSNDDFEKMYKGEVSKSGVAILPSKRMRKAPIQTSTSDIKKNEDTKKTNTTEETKEPLKLTEEAEAKTKEAEAKTEK